MTRLLSGFALLAASQAPKPPAYDPLHPPPYDSAWTREAWTADEAPYVTIRKEVEAYTLGRRVSKTKTDLVGRTQGALTSVKANPKNPIILYRAAYYEYMLAGLDYSPEARELLRKNGIAMSNLPSPHSREYDRLRMLREGFLNEAFLDLGERLYKLDPDDREVALKLAWTHARFGPGSRERALEIATRLLKTGDPKAYPAIYFAYANAHDMAYAIGPDKANPRHMKESFWGYRKYIASGPDWRAKAIEAKRRLTEFEQYLKEHDQPVPSG